MTARGRAAALLRVALLPVVYIAFETARVDTGDWFAVWFGLAALWAGVTAAAAWSDRFGMPGGVAPVVDVALLCALAHETGGAASQLRHVFLAVPLFAAFFVPAPATAACAAGALAAYAATAAIHPADANAELVTSHLLAAAWIGAASIAVSVVLARRMSDIGTLADARGRLLTELLGAEERERRQLADALHDGPVQALALARVRLTTAKAAGADGLDSAEAAITEATGQLRSTIRDLHPYVLDAAGLAAALEAAAHRTGGAGETEYNVNVAPEAEGHRDRLVFAVARELLANVAKHAHARHVDVEVVRTADAIHLTVADDGRGLDQVARAAAVKAGHIGLASCEQRLGAAGGTLSVGSSPGAGTWVEATIPLRRAADATAPIKPQPSHGLLGRVRSRYFERSAGRMTA